MKENITGQLQEIVKKLTKEDIDVSLSVPKDTNNGDYMTTVAFQLAKILKKNPRDVAALVARDFGNLSGIKFVEPAGAGFINFYLSDETLSENLQSVLKSPEKVVGIRKNPKYKKAIVEYSSPNIAKPFTIGHLRSTIIGDAVANLLEAVGYEVFRDNHLGDWGTQFGKQIYAIKTWGNQDEIARSENPVKELVALYVKFHEEAEKNPELEEEGRKWFKKLEDGDAEARSLWQKCIQWSFQEFERIYEELGVHFTENNGRGYGEAFFEDKMQPILDELRKKNLLKKDKNAKLVFFPKDKYPPLMIVKADGATLYATRDLATDKFRSEHYGKDILIINEVGVEQSFYFKQLYETEYLLGWYKPGQRIHIGHGLYRFKEGKMSTRKGNVIWLEDVLNEAERRAGEIAMDQGLQKMGAHGSEIKLQHIVGGQSVRDQVTKQVAIGALKWNDLKRTSNLDVTFDWDEILSMNGNSGPYIQYAYTRTQSVLKKAESNDIQIQLSKNYTPQKEELNLSRKLVHFPEIIENAAENYAPQMICEFLFETAQLFSNFYQTCTILHADTQEERNFRLALTQATGIILKQGLTLLGIQAPDSM